MSERIFKLISRELHEPLDGGYTVEAIEISEDGPPLPPEYSRFVVMEKAVDMTGVVHRAHFYQTMDQAITAFWKGVRTVVSPPIAPRQTEPMDTNAFIKKMIADVSIFVGHGGYLKSTVTSEPDEKPWFLAEVGDEIDCNGIAYTVHPPSEF